MSKTSFTVPITISLIFTITPKKQPESRLLRFKLHKKLISRIFYALSSRKIRFTVFQILKQIGLLPDKNYKIIDVACGNDSLLIDMAKKYMNSEIKGNDLKKHLTKLISNRYNGKNLTFSNYDICAQEFCKDKVYNLILCKNTLHHIPKTEHYYLLKKLVKACKNLIIIDIENPKKTSLRSYLWNFYYRKFLYDDEDNFISFREFKNILIKLREPGILILYGALETIKGRYLIAVVQNNKKYNATIK